MMDDTTLAEEVAIWSAETLGDLARGGLDGSDMPPVRNFGETDGGGAWLEFEDGRVAWITVKVTPAS